MSELGGSESLVHLDSSWVPPILHTPSYKDKHKTVWVQLEHWLHSSFVHKAVIMLLFIDMALVLIGGVLESQYLASEIADYEEFVEVCTNANDHRRLLRGRDGTSFKAWRASMRDSLRRLASGDSSEGVDCAHPHFGNHKLHDIERVFVIISVVILAVFLAENFLLLMCVGVEFFSNPFYVMDISVVSLSIGLEVLALSQVLTEMPFVGLLVLARAWRFARVGHGVYSAGERHKKTNEHTNETLGGHCEQAAKHHARKVAPES